MGPRGLGARAAVAAGAMGTDAVDVTAWVRALSLALASMLCVIGCEGVSFPSSDGGLPETREPFDNACYRCHGNSLSPAPPRAVGGGMDSTYVGVGAHSSHLGQEATWHTPVECESCHVVPDVIDAVGHIDDGDNIAEVVFGGRALLEGATPTWDRSSETCSDVYCHGATMQAAGNVLAPQWTLVDGSQRECGTCHGAPPPAPHSQDANCGGCHPTMEPNSLTFRDPNSHIDGKIDVGDGGSCDSCHGSDGNAAPPRDLMGNSDRSALGVGAHREHLALSSWRREISCSSCHVAPVDVGDAGHLDGDDVAEVSFDVFNPSGTFNRGTATCSNLYCHGNGRGSNGSALWTSSGDMSCSSCHSMGSGLGGEHGEHLGEGGIDCDDCHSDVIDAGRNIVSAELHLNGQREVKMSQGTYEAGTRRCSNLSCHGSETW